MPEPKKLLKYGAAFPWSKDPLDLEFDMCRKGGRWKTKFGHMMGEGMFFHFKQAMHILWPEIIFHDWADRQIRCYLDYRIIGQLGPASTGKTFVPSACVLLDYYMYPHCTTVLVSSTTRESLEMRVLGEVKKLHRLARERHAWIPGNLIEGKQRIVTDDRSIAAEGRDFRNGLVGIAVKRGQNYQGIEEYVGIKNKRIRCLFDEAQFLPRVFVDSIANLNKNPDLKAVVSGNPKDVTDALGIVCEPAAHLGGWDGGIDQTGGTKEWETRYNKGVCLQLVGTDSPNLDGKLGIPLITQEQIDTDIRFYGEDSLQFSMMDLGRMPRGQSQKRVITRQMCLKFHAMEEPIWKDDNRVKIGFLDAAYRGTGGDRTVFGEIQFGAEPITESTPSVSAIVTQKVTDRSDPQILAVIDTIVVPVTMDPKETPEDQIAVFVKAECERRGIAPENFFFDTTGRGSLMNAFGRLWSPNVQGIEFGGKPTERKVSGDMDIEASRYYYNFVSELWFACSYLIQAGQCRGMTEDVMMEGCMREWGFQGGKIQVEPKDKMKVKCFTSGTMISTPLGSTPIQDLKSGDIVSTPMGPTRIYEVTKFKTRGLCKAVFSDGTELIGTPDHEIFTWDRGWVWLSRLRLTDTLERSRTQVVWQLLSAFFTVGTSTTFKEMVNTISADMGGTATRSELYTVRSFTIWRAAFRLGGRFIIKMVTPIIMLLQILSCGWSLNIARSTQRTAGSINVKECLLPSVDRRKRCGRGTSRKMDKHGIVQGRKPCGTLKSREDSHVKSVVGCLMRCVSKLQDFVLEGATTDTGVTKARCRGIVRFAERLFSLVAMIKPQHAHLIAVESCDGPEQDVYDLTLCDHNVYYANGVLVSNSGRSPDLFDAFVCGVEGARRRGFVIKRQVAVAHKRIDHTWKKQLRERAQNLARAGVLDHAA